MEVRERGKKFLKESRGDGRGCWLTTQKFSFAILTFNSKLWDLNLEGSGPVRWWTSNFAFEKEMLYDKEVESNSHLLEDDS